MLMLVVLFHLETVYVYDICTLRVCIINIDLYGVLALIIVLICVQYSKKHLLFSNESQHDKHF